MEVTRSSCHDDDDDDDDEHIALPLLLTRVLDRMTLESGFEPELRHLLLVRARLLIREGEIHAAAMDLESSLAVVGN